MMPLSIIVFLHLVRPLRARREPIHCSDCLSLRNKPAMPPLTIWMNMPSFHQDGLFEALPGSGEIDLRVIFARGASSEHRSSDGRKGIGPIVTVSCLRTSRSGMPFASPGPSTTGSI